MQLYIAFCLLFLLPLMAFCENGEELVVCPDKVSACPDGSTCCPLGEGTYGCFNEDSMKLEYPRQNAASPVSARMEAAFPRQNAAVSSRRELFSGRKTNEVECINEDSMKLEYPRQNAASPVSAKMEAAFPRQNAAVSSRRELFSGRKTNEVECSDGKSKCPSGTTCCALGGGMFGCCPVPNANDESTPWYRKFPATKVVRKSGVSFKPSTRPCNGGVCRGDESCCESSSLRALPECCRFREGICCGDGTCCPKGYKCHRDGCKVDSFEVTVTAPSAPIRSGKYTFDSSEEENEETISCSDGSQCPAGNTCCPIENDRAEIPTSYQCLPNAVCCEDHLHCCPQGTQCDVSEGRCTNSLNDESTPWYRKFSATKVVRKSGVSFKPSTRPCNGGLCRGDESCCESSSLRALPECCRFREGICCGDGTCCPKGYKCHRDGCKVDSFEVTVTAPSAPIRSGKYTFDSSEEDNEETISCSDGSQCPAGNTCCPIENDRAEVPTSYQCCALAHATCCDSACCPRGFHCVDGNRCEKSALTRELLREILFN
uniref:Granulins domain-containing protein n=1 Tax=Panagrolaimus sp. ES5 TaxID=591445 RepID=A0AC34FNG5_9BILA